MSLSITPREIDEIAAKAEEPVARHMILPFDRQILVETDEGRKDTLRLIVEVLRLTFYFHPEETYHPFGKPGGMHSHQNLAPEQASSLGEIVSSLKTPELRALFADMAWLRVRGNPDMARTAVYAYIESARKIEDADHWPDTARRVERAMRLGRSLGSEDASYEAAKSYALELVHKHRGEDKLFLTGKIVELLLDFRIGKASDYSGYVRHAATNARDGKRYHVARYYFDLLAKIGRRGADDAATNDALRELAKTFEAEGRDLEATDNNMAAAHFYTSAIQAYRRVANSSAEIEALRLDLQRAERASVAQMKKIQSDPVDISGEMVKAREHVSGHDKKTALIRFAFVVPLAKADEMRKQAARLAEMSIARKIADMSHVDAEGRVVGREPAASGDEVTFAQMVEQYQHHRRFVVQAYILPALEQLNLEHDLTLSELSGFAHHSPFVPDGREEVFGKGLLAGFQMDCLVAIHLLLPQIENSIRHLMQLAGMITTKLDQYGIQRQCDLNELLVNDKVQTLLSENIIVELRTLLVDNRGPNLRHQAAHGMLDDAAFMSVECIYAWWLVLNLCMFGPSIRAPSLATSLETPSDDADAPKDQTDTPLA